MPFSRQTRKNVNRYRRKKINRMWFGIFKMRLETEFNFRNKFDKCESISSKIVDKMCFNIFKTRLQFDLYFRVRVGKIWIDMVEKYGRMWFDICKKKPIKCGSISSKRNYNVVRYFRGKDFRMWFDTKSIIHMNEYMKFATVAGMIDLVSNRNLSTLSSLCSPFCKDVCIFNQCWKRTLYLYI